MVTRIDQLLLELASAKYLDNYTEVRAVEADIRALVADQAAELDRFRTGTAGVVTVTPAGSNPPVLHGVSVEPGYLTPYATVQTYMFQADSPSLEFWDTILEAQKAQNETLELYGTLIIQGIDRKYALVKGFITSATPAPTSKKVLQPRKFVVTWQSVTPAPN